MNVRATMTPRRRRSRINSVGRSLVICLFSTIGATASASWAGEPAAAKPESPSPMTRPIGYPPAADGALSPSPEPEPLTVEGVRGALDTLYQDTGVPEELTRSLNERERKGTKTLAARPATRVRPVAKPRVGAVVSTPAPAPPQPVAPPPAPAPAPLVAPAPEPGVGRYGLLTPVDRSNDPSVEKAGCTTCGGYHTYNEGPVISGGCPDGQCIPGRQACDALVYPCDTVLGGFFSNLYQSLCCPDPCYQPRWEPAANASLFADYARPRTITRFRYDNLENMIWPDRNQYFLKQTPLAWKKNPYLRSSPAARLQDFYYYQEIAGPKGSFFFEMPYRQVNPLYGTTQAGFGDIRFGTKSLIYDVEMFQVSFQFKTYTPSGNAMNGLGTGHVSLEPSLLASLKLTPSTFFQAQLGEWIPLGATNAFNNPSVNGKAVPSSNVAGGLFFAYMSLNQVLCHLTPSSPLIGTFEMDCWSFQDGGYTNPYLLPKHSTKVANIPSGGGVSYFNAGPGLRLSICNKVDLGSAITWSTTSAHWAQPWFRFEVRFLF